MSIRPIARVVLFVVFAALADTAFGAPTDLGTLGGSYSAAHAVSANGQIVGESTTAGDAALHAFSWTATGGMVDLGTLGGSYSSAYAVNASGQVVGYSGIAGDVATHAFLWTATGRDGRPRHTGRQL